MTEPRTINDRPPNFRNKDGRLMIIRCFACPDAGPYGKENWGPAVATGECAWCGFRDEKDAKND